MTRDSEIAAIFNPSRRVRAPSVVVTGDSPNGPGSFMSGFANVINSSNPQIGRSDSISQTDGLEIGPGTTNIHGSNAVTTPTTNIEMPQNRSRLTKCKESCCSELAQKVMDGISTESVHPSRPLITTDRICFIALHRCISVCA